MLRNKVLARCTLAAYTMAFVLSDYGAIRPVAAERPAARPAVLRPADVARMLGVTAASAPAAESDVPLDRPTAVGQPNVLDSRSPLSAALMTASGGPGSTLHQVALLGDWDGREDHSADRAQNLEDSSSVPDAGAVTTRVAISEHTVANGFDENVYYYGDSVGNVVVGVDTSPGIGAAGPSIDQRLTLNLPALRNAFGSLNSNSRIVVTGVVRKISLFPPGFG